MPSQKNKLSEKQDQATRLAAPLAQSDQDLDQLQAILVFQHSVKHSLNCQLRRPDLSASPERRVALEPLPSGSHRNLLLVRLVSDSLLRHQHLRDQLAQHSDSPRTLDSHQRTQTLVSPVLVKPLLKIHLRPPLLLRLVRHQSQNQASASHLNLEDLVNPLNHLLASDSLRNLEVHSDNHRSQQAALVNRLNHRQVSGHHGLPPRPDHHRILFLHLQSRLDRQQALLKQLKEHRALASHHNLRWLLVSHHNLCQALASPQTRQLHLVNPPSQLPPLYSLLELLLASVSPPNQA